MAFSDQTGQSDLTSSFRFRCGVLKRGEVRFSKHNHLSLFISPDPFFHTHQSSLPISSYLQSNPPPHPRRNNRFRLIHKSHIKQNLYRPSNRRIQRRENPRMRITRMLTNKHRLELRVIISWEIQILLADERRRPCASLVLIDLPTLPVVVARPLLGCDGAVDFHHCALDHGDVIFF